SAGGYDEAMSTDVITKKLFTVDEFQRMGEVGILAEDCRYELIRGEVIEMPRPGSPHASRVKRLNRLFTSRLGESVIVSVQDPVILDRYSEPVPDVALLRPRVDFYASENPSPEDVLLLVEVADSSLKWDRTVKAELYAETKIAEYWVLDVRGGALIVHSNPQKGAYETIVTLCRGETIRPSQLSGIVFTVDEILGME
ncbi:MAG TPA: Uma2 family endonuclease, partial [Terriglobia bacterium]|nr:Uma2 family endonuclease [Terriglobia bacterium]